MIKRDYYNNGQLRYEHPYYKGQFHGIVRYWYNNGQPDFEHPYHEGQIHGVMRGWYENGKSCYKTYYLYGDQVTEEEYRRHELIVALSGL